MQVVQHNLMSMFTQRELKTITGQKAKSTEKLSSGYRINRAGDDAAGLAISEKMRWQIRGLDQGQKNTQDGLSWIQVGDGAMGEIEELIHRISELATQASNDTNTDSDRFQINEEIKQIKKEINRIGTTTQFNTKDVFDNSYVQMDVNGSPGDVEVFDASYDDQTGDVMFGGFIFNDERISWGDINTDPSKVSGTIPANWVEMDNGKQIFHEADFEYTFTPKNGGPTQTFHFKTEEGAEVPDVERIFSISADVGSGITVDGYTMPWSDLFDEDGNSLSASNIHSGAWALNYKGCEINFYIPDHMETLDDVAKAITSLRDGKVQYTWKAGYTGNSSEQAVDATIKTQYTKVDGLFSSLVVRADEDGIWMESADNKLKKDNTFQSWEDMEVLGTGENFSNSTKISGNKAYFYEDPSKHVDFTFTLSNVTSVDSIIDGIDGMTLTAEGAKTNYTTTANIQADGIRIIGGHTKTNVTIDYDQEKILGRNFEIHDGDVAKVDEGEYNPGTKTGTLKFSSTGISTGGTGTVDFTGSTAAVESQLTNDVNSFLNEVEQRKVMMLMQGKDPEDYDRYTSITDVVGSGAITTSGHIDEIFTLEGVDGYTNNGYEDLTNHLTAQDQFAGAKIDFATLTADKLAYLDGLGFNSTCWTCDRHYTVQFADNLSWGYSETQDHNYRYRYEKAGQDDVLTIDINSLKAQGVSNGTSLAASIVEIANQCSSFTNHYTQYANKGSTLYIFDERGSNSQYSVTDPQRRTREGIFGTMPWDSHYVGSYTINTKSGDDKIDLTYDYNFRDASKLLDVEMDKQASGSYVRVDPNDETKGYTLYDPQVHTDGRDRYNLIKTWSGGSKNDAVTNYVSSAVDYMLERTGGLMHTNDYTKANMLGEERNNVAIRANYDSFLEETPYENGIHIQNSSNVGDYHIIPRFPMNTVALKLNRADVRTYDSAQKTMDYARKAVDILNERRGVYGAYQNRLEHTLASSGNAEENQQASESRLRDTDMAKEMVNYSKGNILAQAAQAMLTQANQQPQGVLSLFS